MHTIAGGSGIRLFCLLKNTLLQVQPDIIMGDEGDPGDLDSIVEDEEEEEEGVDPTEHS